MNVVQKNLLLEIHGLITDAQLQASVAVNAGLTMLYWQIGTRINQEILQGQRAEYGKTIVLLLAQGLTQEFGRAFEEKNLRRMMQFATDFAEEQIVATLSRQLSWSHFKELLPIKKDLQREFYLQMAQLEHWSVRQLRERIGSQLYERTALSKKPELTIRHDLEQLRSEKKISPALLLKDPYILDFLGLQDRYLEKDLEDAILREIEQFLLEMGAGFTFVARQKRIQLDNDDFYIDLLLYNRKLKRLVAIDLKIGDFEAGFKGQMELYLRYLAKFEQEQGEASPLGIILCTGKKQEQIELLELDKSGIHVAEYQTVVPLLHNKLKQIQQKLEQREKP
jgi:predicted nuclease of restriction endonuclease-like (RecB) superfamily